MQNTTYPRKEGPLFEDTITVRSEDGRLITAILISEDLGDAVAVDPKNRNKIVARGKIKLEKTTERGSATRTLVFDHKFDKTILNTSYLTGRKGIAA